MRISRCKIAGKVLLGISGRWRDGKRRIREKNVRSDLGNRKDGFGCILSMEITTGGGFDFPAVLKVVFLRG